MSVKKQVQKDPDLELNHKALLSFLRVSTLITNFAETFFAGFGTTGTEFNILMTLNNHHTEGGLSQTELSEELILKKSNLVGLIDKLEVKALVTRQKLASDRRLNKICLTGAGKAFIKKIEGNYFKEVNKLMEQLSQNEKANLENSMKKLYVYLKSKT
jgi:DNA-binding MarR family transcriptional regulator